MTHLTSARPNVDTTPAGNGRGVGEAHAKVILVGEHAVLYGHPAIAAPVPSLKVRVTAARPTTETKTTDTGSSALRSIDSVAKLKLPYLENMVEQMGATLNELSITVLSDIPGARGLGSSAAVGLALVRSLADLQGRLLSHDDELKLVAVMEAAAHGTASGIDALAASRPSGLIWFCAGESRPQPVAPNCTAALLIVDSGQRSNTKNAVDKVRALRANRPNEIDHTFERIGSVVRRTAALLTAGDMTGLGEAFTENHRILCELGLSTAHLDAIVSSAIKSGALGAKVSGGGQGGCVVVLCPSRADAVNLGIRLSDENIAGHWITDLEAGSSPL